MEPVDQRELKQEHAWLTRKDLFENVWGNIKSMLEINPCFNGIYSSS